MPTLVPPRALRSNPFAASARALVLMGNGAVAERSKAHAWKVCIRQKRIEGSNPSCSANHPQH